MELSQSTLIGSHCVAASSCFAFVILQQLSCSNTSQATLFVTSLCGGTQVNELARMSEQEVSEYRKQLNGIKVGAAALPYLLLCHVLSDRSTST